MKLKDEIELLISKYNQKGEGVGFYQTKPVYVFGTIVGEKVLATIEKIEPNYLVGKLKTVLLKSPNRVEHQVKDAHKIGGYELIHMNDQEQINFKKTRIINDFKQIAKTDIDPEQLEVFVGQKRIKYRNKITLHDGNFYQKQTNEKIIIDDYLLSDIQYDPNLKGEIIYRQLDTLIYGTKNENKYTSDSMFGYKFRVGLNSFYQVNKEVALAAYQDILDYVIEGGITLDLYSGIATIAIIVSKKSKKVYGVEVNQNSYQDALFNIKNNKIKNIEFINQDVKDFLKHFDFTKIPIDTLILDPARAGIKKTEIDQIIKLKPKRIIYLACNPGNQAANFHVLKEYYQLSKIKIYDMFCQTYHIESLIVLDLIK